MYKTGHNLKIQPKQFHALQLLTEGVPIEKIAVIIFGCANEDGSVDEEALAAAKKTLRKWFKDPKMVEAHKELCKEAIMGSLMRSIKKLDQMIENPNDWLQYNASTFWLNKFGSLLFDENDKTVKVEVVGMPEMGKPEE